MVRALVWGGRAAEAAPYLEGHVDDTLSPRIVATQEGRVNLGKGDKAYVMGDLNGATSFQAWIVTAGRIASATRI